MRLRSARFDSIEEWYEAVWAVGRHRRQAAAAMAALFPGPGARLTTTLSDWDIDWEDVEHVSRPFLLAADSMRLALEGKLNALAAVAEERYRYLPVDVIAPESAQALSTYREIRALPEGTFVARPECLGEHALALYDLLAPKIPPSRRRGLRWPAAGTQQNNQEAIELVAAILGHYYTSAPDARGVKGRLQAARKARSRR